MRKPRFTYKEAFHHIVSRGYEGHFIFGTSLYKNYLLELIKEERHKKKIRIFAYCIMDNHYHLILQNSSGKLSEFMRDINGKFGRYYRLKESGKGYVFQDRYKSTLIENDTYLKMAIVYVLLNPTRSHVVSDPYSYSWSSIKEYFDKNKDTITDINYIKELFSSKNEFLNMINDWRNKKLPEEKTELGYILGNNKFYKESLKRYNRRKKSIDKRYLRKDDYKFPSASEIIREFENKNNISIENINTSCFSGKKLRGELLVLLKDYGGLTYREIKQISIFRELRFNSLGSIYRNFKSKKMSIK